MLADGGSGRRGDRIRKDSRGSELGGDPSDKVSVLSLHVSSYRVVPGESARAVGARDADALVALADVGAQVRLVAVGAFAERTLELSTRATDTGAVADIGRVAHGHGEAHVVAGGQSAGKRDGSGRGGRRRRQSSGSGTLQDAARHKMMGIAAAAASRTAASSLLFGRVCRREPTKRLQVGHLVAHVLLTHADV